MARTVAVNVTANVGSGVANLQKMGVSAKTAATAVNGLGSAADKAAGATARLAAAQGKAANAAGAVRAAEARLAEIRAKGAASSAKGVAAEERLAAARRKLAAASGEAAVASAELGAANGKGASSLSRLTSSVDKHSASLNTIGSSLTKVGLFGAVALGASAKAAIDWQSAWAGVNKTINGTPDEMKALEAGLRGLATTLPESHTQIAAVAEAAGQLGIQQGAILGFTKTMVQLGDTTNLSSDEAATGIAQLENIMGGLKGTAAQTVTNVSQLGSQIVALGNNGASTEKDILAMGLRIAGAGNQIGLSQGQVLAFASTLSSVGINAEAGGTAISSAFIKIDGDVRKGGKALDVLAVTSGTTSAQFKKNFQTDAAGAVNDFVLGLGRVQAAGGDVTAILDKVGITGIRGTDAFRRLAGAGNLLGDSLKLQNSAFAKNNALAREAATRYATTGSQIQVAWNKIKDAAITAGGATLPAIARIAGGAGKLATAFSKLPSGAQNAALGVAAVGTAAALAVGGGIKLVTSISNIANAMSDLRTKAPKAAGAIGAVGKAAGVAAIAIVALEAAGAIQNVIKPAFTANLEGAAKSLLDLANVPSANLDDKFKFSTGLVIKDNVDSLGSAFQRLDNPKFGDSIAEGLDKMLGQTDAVTTKIKLQFAGLDSATQALSSSGHQAEAAAGFKKIADEARLQGFSMEKLKALFPQYAAATQTAAEANGNVITSTDQLVTLMSGGVVPGFKGAQGAAAAAGGAIGSFGKQVFAAIGVIGNLSSSTDLTAASVKKLGDGVLSSVNAFQSVQQASSAYQASIDDASAAIKTNGKTLNDHTAKGRANIAALDGMASAGKNYALNLAAQGASTKRVAAVTQDARDNFIKSARAAGLGAGAARRLADSYGLIPKDVSTQINILKDAQVKAKVDAIAKALIGVPPKTTSVIESIYKKKGADAALQALALIDGKTGTFKVDANSKAALAKILGVKKTKLPDKTQHVKGDTSDANRKLSTLQRLKLAVKTAKAKGDTSAADSAMRKLNAYKIAQKTAKAKGDTSNAVSAIRRVDGMRSGTTTVHIVGSGAGAVQSQINQIHGKTVVIHQKTVKSGNKTASAQAAGGLAGEGRVVARAAGGPVWGRGTSTSDSIDAKLSNGEFVLRAAAVRAIGVDEARRLNALGGPSNGFAAGGAIGFAAGGSVDTGIIARLIAAIADPLKALAGLTVKVAAAQKALDAAKKADAKPRAAYEKATANYVAARDAKAALTLKNAKQTEAAKERVAAAQKAVNTGKATKAEKAELSRARAAAAKVARDNALENAKATKRVTDLGKVRTTAQTAYAAGAAKEKAASDALKASQEALASQQQAVADSAKAVADTFMSAYRTQSTDASDWISLMNQGAKDIGGFTAKIAQLRAAGLNEALIQQIIGLGATAGTEIATQVAAGGKGLVDSLNKANDGLTKAADSLGLTASLPPSGKVKMYAAGGLVSGAGTGTSDSIAARLSHGEYVVNAAATAANRAALDGMNYGRQIVDRNYVQGFASGGYVQRAQVIDTAAIVAAIRDAGGTVNFNGPVGYDPNVIANRIQTRKRDAMAMTGQTVHI